MKPTTAAETALFAIARTLAPALDGSTPVLSLTALEAVRDRLETRADEMARKFVTADERAEAFEQAGARETAALFEAEAKAAHDQWWNLRIEVQAANDDIKEWLKIALGRAAA
jgi:phage I-like protein